MFGRSIRVARIAGIPVGISPWWLAIVAFLTWSLGSGYFSERAPGLAPVAALALALASVLAVFAGILAHEFAHALVARRAGVVIEEVDLWLLGGVARMRNQPGRAVDELRFALAGPAVTAVIALAFGLLAWRLSPAAPAGLRAFVDYQLQVNTAIVIFNLLPALPLDGGRAARAILWLRTGDLRRSTAIAANAGRGIGYALAWLGLLAVLAGYLVGAWAAMVGMFIVGAAASERRRVELGETLDGVVAEELMSSPAVVLTADESIAHAREVAARRHFTTFPVVDEDGVALGLVTAERISHLHGATTVGETAIRSTSLLLGPGDPAATLLERPEFTQVGRAVVVDPAGRPLGVISITDMARALAAPLDG